MSAGQLFCDWLKCQNFRHHLGTPEQIFGKPDLHVIVRPFKWFLGFLYFMDLENRGQTAAWPGTASMILILMSVNFDQPLRA